MRISKNHEIETTRIIQTSTVKLIIVRTFDYFVMYQTLHRKSRVRQNRIQHDKQVKWDTYRYFLGCFLMDIAKQNKL